MDQKANPKSSLISMGYVEGHTIPHSCIFQIINDKLYHKMYCYLFFKFAKEMIRLSLTRLSILRKSDDIRMLITFVVSVSKNQHNGCKYSDTKTDDLLHICSFLTTGHSSK